MEMTRALSRSEPAISSSSEPKLGFDAQNDDVGCGGQFGVDLGKANIVVFSQFGQLVKPPHPISILPEV
jgi:hypothetical protein